MIDQNQVMTHEPFCPVRANVIGEVVMVSKWQAIVGPKGLTWSERHQSLLARILTCEVTPRATAVAASAIRWIGTNCGRAFLDDARKLIATVRDDAYLFAWAKANMRMRGMRLIEHILASPGDFARMSSFPALGLKSRPHVTSEDHEVIECLMAWLGSEAGQRYLAGCESDIRACLKAQSQVRL
ncbi:hypothetical protein [Pseudomonas putida]|uniref:hypothetical protein n=1 Tax=Pseudomonas putida TaxID=303 RepID=UPI0038054D73